MLMVVSAEDIASSDILPLLAIGHLVDRLVDVIAVQQVRQP
jgi:hypothetical protein